MLTPTLVKITEKIIDLRSQRVDFEERGYSVDYAGDEFEKLEADLAKYEFALSTVELVLNEID